jgi:AhpD family alkylhydroperoxidase
MKNLYFLLALICVSSAWAKKPAAKVQEKTAEAHTEQLNFKGDALVAMQEAKTLLGRVPTFFNYFPESAIPGAWQEFRDLQLSDKTALPGKYKELIGAAVAAQIPCHYCSYFHNKAVTTLHNGQQKEVFEAIAISALTRHWSTFFNGINLDESSFKKEVDKMIKAQESTSASTASTASFDGTNNFEKTYSEIKNMFGFIPEFLKKFPQGAVTGAWEELKMLEFNNSSIPAKYKALIGLGVASQVPCKYCIYMDTKTALSEGASEKEIYEAIALASITRHWSTVLNGNLITDAEFTRDTDFIFNYLKKGAAAKQLGEMQKTSDEQTR